MLKKNTVFQQPIRKGLCVLRRRNVLCYAFGSVRDVAGKGNSCATYLR